METVETFPTCASCRHDWHGLDCTAPVVTIARHGRRTDRCGCRAVPVAGSAVPDAAA